MKFTDWFTQHEDAEIRAQVRAATRFGMSDAEREKTRAYLERHIALYPSRALRPVSRISILFHPMPLIASLLIIVVSGVSVAGAAESALPGDALYAVKVNVNEEVKLALATSPEKRADVTLERAERRLQELAALNELGEVDETLREEIDERIDAHVRDAEERSTEIDESRARDIEHRVLAVLRAHEVLVSPGEIGGFSEPATDIASIAAADANSADLATGSVPDSAAPAATMMMAVEAPVARSAAITADEPTAQPAPETMRMAADAPVAKQAGADVSEKILKRQEKTARERIESLEKLIAREEKENAKRDNARDTSVLTTGLASARDAFENARVARENGNSLDAAALFNGAIRFAIDAREMYTEESRTRESERETRVEQRAGDDRTNRTDDSRHETGDNRSGRSRDRDD